MPAAAPLLTTVLKEVSRSFYLTLRFLPAPVREQIGLAYLLARAADTIADTQILPVPDRLLALDRLCDRIGGGASSPAVLGQFTRHQGTPGERVLLERIEEVLTRLDDLQSRDRDLVREVLQTIASGQKLDLQRFPSTSQHELVALPTALDLDDYTYRVAGCVGQFWTQICREHLFPSLPINTKRLLRNAVRFGKGLQLVNILRDIPRDLRQGRCYLPADQLAQAGLSPQDLLDPANESRLRPLYDHWLSRAQAHLAAGWDYTNSLPRNLTRLRLVCSWPILIGVRTLWRLAHERVLSPAQPAKITRLQVYGLMGRSILIHPWPSAWRRLFTPNSLFENTSRTRTTKLA